MKYLIKNARIVNDGAISEGDLLTDGVFISKIAREISASQADRVIDIAGNFLIPGAIDDQVHFREPGLTHKGNIASESRAAIAGGITTFIEQPNTVPNAVTLEILEEKYSIASQNSFANYSFMLGATNDNISEVVRIDPKRIAGVKIFMGSSTGNMLVDNETALEQIFRHSPTLIAVHCEDEATVKANLEHYKEIYGDNIPPEAHPLIRSAEACFLSSSRAVALAKSTGARLHIFHVSTARETKLFDNNIPLIQKKITAEACIHHLWFSDADYAKRGNFIKWNPAVKTAEDREALWNALIDGRIDVIATDHAPHTIEEKNQKYLQAPSGGPMVQHAVVAMFDSFQKRNLPLELLVEKMSHNPAILFEIEKRGFIREGYFADMAIVDADSPWQVAADNILYHCGWSPMEGITFNSRVTHTFVNGNLVYENGVVNSQPFGQRLQFNR